MLLVSGVISVSAFASVSDSAFASAALFYFTHIFDPFYLCFYIQRLLIICLFFPKFSVLLKFCVLL